MSAQPGPPDQICFDLEEALELLAAMEDAWDALIASDYLVAVAQIEHQIANLSRKLGFEQPPGGEDGR